jgi:hypothetical protein
MLFRLYAYPRRASPSARLYGVTYKFAPLGASLTALIQLNL